MNLSTNRHDSVPAKLGKEKSEVTAVYLPTYMKDFELFPAALLWKICLAYAFKFTCKLHK